MATKKTIKGDILLARYGASVGKVFWAEDGAYNVAMAKVNFNYSTEQINKNYIFLFYHSNIYQSLVKNNSRSAQAGFNKDDLSNLFFPLPPYKEQVRIVEEYKKIVPYLDKFEKYEIELHKLNTEFPEMLKKSILQQAVQGKLVPQDPTDEPAEVLFARIREEKQRLIKEGKIKKDKHESVIYRRDNSHYEKLDGKEHCIDDELPFEIPKTWCWVRLGSIFYHNTGKALNASNKLGKMMEYITTSNVYWNRFELNKLKMMLFTDSELEKCTITKGDLLVCEGGDIGRAAIWSFDYNMRIQNHIHRLRSYAKISTEFFYYLFYFYKNTGLIDGKGIGIQGLSSNALHNLLFPLPPLVEQERIVAKIDELLTFAEKLK